MVQDPEVRPLPRHLPDDRLAEDPEVQAPRDGPRTLARRVTNAPGYLRGEVVGRRSCGFGQRTWTSVVPVRVDLLIVRTDVLIEEPRSFPDSWATVRFRPHRNLIFVSVAN